jgi:hypothetical protein
MPIGLPSMRKIPGDSETAVDSNSRHDVRGASGGWR